VDHAPHAHFAGRNDLGSEVLRHVKRARGAQDRIVVDHAPEACFPESALGRLAVEFFGGLVEDDPGHPATGVEKLADGEAQVAERAFL